MVGQRRREIESAREREAPPPGRKNTRQNVKNGKKKINDSEPVGGEFGPVLQLLETHQNLSANLPLEAKAQNHRRRSENKCLGVLKVSFENSRFPQAKFLEIIESK